MFTRRYNIYDMIMRAAAGDPPSGGGQQEEADPTANAPTINMEDPEPEANAKPPETEVKADGDKTEDPPAEGKTEPPKRPAVVPRESMLKRVGDLTRDKKTLAQENEALKLRLAAAEKKEGEEDPPAPKLGEYKTQEDFERAVAQAAQAQIEQAQFNDRCNAVADAGEKTYKTDWNESVENLRMLSDDGNIPKLLIDAALEADDPAQALHALGQNPEEAMRIMKLPAIKQVAEVVKYGTKKAVAKAAIPAKTKAPEPPEPLNGGGGNIDTDAPSDGDTDDEWYAKRQAEVQKAAIDAAQRNGGARIR